MTRRFAVAACFFLALPATAPLAAQSVAVRVTEAETGQPIYGALAHLLSGGDAQRSALTDERGRALFVGVEPGSYGLRVEMIGRRTAEVGDVAVPVGETVLWEIRMESSAISLEGISVEAEGGRCRVRPEEGLLVAEVWEEVRKGLAAAALTDREQVYRYRTVRWVRDLDRDSKAVRGEERRRSGGYLRTPFESRPAEDLLENGFVQAGAGGDLYFAPDAPVLLSDPFLDTHCFGLERGEDEAAGLLGLTFEPTGQRKRVPDIAGTLWVDPATSELQWLDYRYQNLDADLTSTEVGGRVVFQRLPDGTWIVPEWRIRMPTVEMIRDARGRLQPYLAAYREVGGMVTRVDEPGSGTVLEAESGTLEGIVLDSLGAEPLRGARVWVEGSDQQVFTGPDGRFRIGGLSGGTYRVAFSHPALDTLGFTPEPVTREVRRGSVTSVRLAMPSVADLLFAACRDEGRPEGSAALLGWVRDAGSGVLLAGAVVRVEWQGDWRFPSQGGREYVRLTREGQGLETTADGEGRYRICAVPEERSLTVTPFYGGVEGDPVTVEIEAMAGARMEILEVPVEDTGTVSGPMVDAGTAPDTFELEGVEVSVLSGETRHVPPAPLPPSRRGGAGGVPLPRAGRVPLRPAGTARRAAHRDAAGRKAVEEPEKEPHPARRPGGARPTPRGSAPSAASTSPGWTAAPCR